MKYNNLPIHLLDRARDMTYCGYPLILLAKEIGGWPVLTLEEEVTTCEECKKAHGLYLLSES